MALAMSGGGSPDLPSRKRWCFRHRNNVSDSTCRRASAWIPSVMALTVLSSRSRYSRRPCFITLASRSNTRQSRELMASYSWHSTDSTRPSSAAGPAGFSPYSAITRRPMAAVIRACSSLPATTRLVPGPSTRSTSSSHTPRTHTAPSFHCRCHDDQSFSSGSDGPGGSLGGQSIRTRPSSSLLRCASLMSLSRMMRRRIMRERRIVSLSKRSSNPPPA
mmetsp:Transcript_44329/g.118284  ORF Transcript_44329/g.118284 Transcript_44329/m.118284 type:complete len:219 (-) Transcript_44329:1209-1865(-)